MPNFNRIEHPILSVEIGGGSPDRRPSLFSLITDEGFPSVVACLKFPADETKGEAGDPVVVNMAVGDEEYLLFTGEIYSVSTVAKHRIIALTDGYKKLCDTQIVAAYRKEQAGVILQDTLDSSGIGETSITCPPVLIHRFSTKKIPAESIITLLIKALEEHSHMGLRFFFLMRRINFISVRMRTQGKTKATFLSLKPERTYLKKASAGSKCFLRRSATPKR